MAAAGVPGAALADLVAPGGGVIAIHTAALVARLIEARQDQHALHAARIGPVDVPLVGALECIGPAGHARMILRFVAHDGFLDRRVRLEVRADQVAVPGPVVLRVAGRVDADVAAAILDEALEGLLLRRVEHVAGRVQEDDHAKPREIGGREGRGVFGCLDGEAGCEQVLHRGDAGLDAVVAEASRLREEQHAGCVGHRWRLGRDLGFLRCGRSLRCVTMDRGGVSRPCSPCRVRCIQHRCTAWRADDRHDEAHCTDDQGRGQHDQACRPNRSPGPRCSAPRDP